MTHNFELSVSPIPQKSVRFYGKRAYDPSKEYKEGLKRQLRKQCSGKLIDGAIAIKIVFKMPIPKCTTKERIKKMLMGEVFHVKRPDVDNLTKAVFDSLNGVVICDDSQIYSLYAKKIYSTCPGISISLRTLLSDGRF